MAKLVRSKQVESNIFRDLETYGYIPSKIASLKDSMKSTKSNWENLLCRIKNGAVADFPDEELFDANGEPTCFVQLGYGHHRMETLRQLFEAGELEGINGVEVREFEDGPDFVFSISVQDLTDPQMLKILANENKDDGTSPITPLLEAVRQTEGIILKELEKAGTYNEYVDAGGTFIESKASWDQLKGKDKVGAPQIAKFYGETWPTNNITNAKRTLEAIAEGKFEQSDVTDFPSAGMLKSFCAFVDNVYAKETWPEYFKKMYVKDMADTIANPKDKADQPTVRTVAAAAKGINGDEELHGLLMARKGSTSRKWNPAIHIKTALQEDGDLTDEQLIEQFGMDDFEGRAELLEAGRKLYESAQKKKEAGAAGEDGAEGDSDELDEMIAGADGEAPLPVEELPPVTDENVGQRISEFVTAANSVAAQGAALMDIGEEHTADPDFIEAVAGLKSIVEGLARVLDI